MDHLAGILLLALPSGADGAAVPAVFYAIQPVGGPWGGQYSHALEQGAVSFIMMISAPIAT